MYFNLYKCGFFVYFITKFMIYSRRDSFPNYLCASLSITQNTQGFSENKHYGLYFLKNGCKLGSKFNNNEPCVATHYTFIAPIKLIQPSKRNAWRRLAKEFNFDERAARRARYRMMVNQNIAKKKMAKRTMRKIVEAVTKETSEEHKSKQIQKFISDIQYVSKRKKLPSPPGIYSPSYDALLYIKGIPFKATEKDVFDWLKNYDVVSVVFIKNENGFFTGDAYVRCVNIGVRDKVAKEMENKTIGGRYIQVFRVSENAYLEYYHSGYRKEPKERNFIDPSVLVITDKQYTKLLESEDKDTCEAEDGTTQYKSFVNNLKNEVDVKNLKTGMRLVGTVTELYRNGVMLDCNIFETRNGVKEKVFCVLKKNRIAKNIGLQNQQYEWLRMKDLVLYPGIRLNLYVEKIRSTTSKNTFDKDLWTEHFDESLIDTYFNTDSTNKTDTVSNDMNSSLENEQEVTSVKPNENYPKEQSKDKRALVYLTMDSSVSEDKVLWWEKKILNSVSKSYEKVDFKSPVVKSYIDYSVNKERVMSKKVKVNNIYEGKSVVHGNIPDQFTLDKSKATNDQVEIKFSHETNDNSQVNETKGSYSGEDISNRALPDDVPIGNLIFGNSEIDLNEGRDNNIFILGKEDKKAAEVEYIDSNYKKLANIFFKNTTVEKDIQLHDFDPEEELDMGGESYLSDSEIMNFDDRSADFNWIMENDNRKDLEKFPRLTLYDGAIKVPPNDLILRVSEVPKLSNEQIEDILELLGKETTDSYERNKERLIEVIKNEGLPTDLLPQTLIQKGLYRVKQSKEYMKKIVNITKDLTGRKFSMQDLDKATTEELQMLVEEALYKFLRWNPPFDIKKQFISNYHNVLDETITLPNISEVVPSPGFMKSSEGEVDGELDVQESLVDQNDENTKRIEKMWNDMKWMIVIYIYGDQSDLKEIVKQLEKDKTYQENQNLKHTPMEVESLIFQSNEK
ncbi:RNA-binding protein, putative [Theileria annulata]|uniref:RNA-binding protein, putative n=1 Tax=Theileria annulata TaxID=5874 RepID=Q4UB49_THEAN|nr:RNA-binding protein, putative [Theileria annulata]CAI75952.1 RNA-binding protein, putative [Theileria annulata]|eukprot:XP_955428.1 RNA-binding protein, putative [Theileria annulata]